MKLSKDIYQDKVMGCWAGKNIGGVLGAPFEGQRQINSIDFYIQDLTQGPPPNDDLDLQIVWLAAVERYGRNVNASILGDYWLSYVIPNWAEYGMGKANLRAGLTPPLSGLIDNTYKDSCGCFIRSEIWACLAPGHPDIAARYAYEDAIVDHEGEGMYGEIFCAAIESAAFVESDIRKLIDIGLSYIPENTALSSAIREAVRCYDGHMEFAEARKRVHNTAPGTFGIQGKRLRDIKKEGNEGMEIGKPGFDAPENVGFTVLALLYGENDFGKSLCLANACGEDTDCTCATLGALMGIILGNSGLPEKWAKPLNDKIATLCIDKTSGGVWVPNTVTELTERVMRDMPAFLGQNLCDIFAPGGMEITCREPDQLYCAETGDYLERLNGVYNASELPVRDLCALTPYTVRYDYPAFTVYIDYVDSIYMEQGKEKTIRVKVVNSFSMHQQQWVRITAYLPAGAELRSAGSVSLPLNNLYGAAAEAEFTLSADNYTGSRLELMIDVSLEGRHSYGAAKVLLMKK